MENNAVKKILQRVFRIEFDGDSDKGLLHAESDVPSRDRLKYWLSDLYLNHITSNPSIVWIDYWLSCLGRCNSVSYPGDTHNTLAKECRTIILNHLTLSLNNEFFEDDGNLGPVVIIADNGQLREVDSAQVLGTLRGDVVSYGAYKFRAPSRLTWARLLLWCMDVKMSYPDAAPPSTFGEIYNAIVTNFDSNIASNVLEQMLNALGECASITKVVDGTATMPFVALDQLSKLVPITTVSWIPSFLSISILPDNCNAYADMHPHPLPPCTAVELFENVKVQPVAQRESNIRAIHATQKNLISVMHAVIKRMLENSTSQNIVLEWMESMMTKGLERTKSMSASRPSDKVYFNLFLVCMRLMRPIIQMISKVKPLFVVENLMESVAVRANKEQLDTYGKRDVMLMPDGTVKDMPSSPSPSSPEKNSLNFITRIFCISIKTLRVALGPILSSLLTVIPRVLPDMEEVKFRAPWIAQKIAAAEAILVAIQVALTENDNIDDMLRFVATLQRYLLHLVFENRDVYDNGPLRQMTEPAGIPMVYAALPEYLFPELLQLMRFNQRLVQVVPRIGMRDDFLEIMRMGVTFCSLFMPGRYISNPHTRAKLAEVVYEVNALNLKVFDTQLAVQYLVPGLLSVHNDVEITGAHAQFYEKFSVRAHVEQVLLTVMEMPAHRSRLVSISNDKTFMLFMDKINNDLTFILDEALEHLKKVKEYQDKAPKPPGVQPGVSLLETYGKVPGSADEATLNNIRITERVVRSNNELGLIKLKVLNNLTKFVTAPMCSVEMVERTATMTNYFLARLVGKEMNDLFIKNKELYHFAPRDLLVNLLGVYIRLSKHPEFLDNVAKDGRSFDIEYFIKAHATVTEYRLMSEPDCESLQRIILQLRQRVEQLVEHKDDYDDAPDEFICPISAEIMSDPVQLPSKHIMERAVIKRMLLSAPFDPFSRAPLDEAMLVPCDDLRIKIAEYKKSKTK